MIKKMCKEEELKRGGKRSAVTRARGKIVYYLSKEVGISMAEIARRRSRVVSNRDDNREERGQAIIVVGE